MELHFDQPTGGDIPDYPIDENWRGDGLLVYRYTTAEAKAWRKAGISVVNLSTLVPDDDSAVLPRVTIDNDAVGQIAYDHLANLGLKHFAYLHESMRLYSELRLASFRKAVEAGGGEFYQVDVPVSSYPARTRPAQIEECLKEQLKALPKPCGLLLKDDIAGVYTSRLLTKIGIKCPDEIALLGISDDIVFCHTTQPPLSSISYPGRKIGFAAIQLLDALMRGKRVANNHWHTLPPGQVIHRESTRHVILSDVLVSNALDYIREETLTRPVSVSELCQKMAASRESLRQRFINALGHSPKKEIERIRCQHLTKRLIETEDTLDAIAIDHGFAGSDEICRYVKRQTGKTPGQVRREQ
ncbi:MAG: substrate-binding domain-containing protein [Akkermansiaceae bacterium]